ncbi:hypothetical protein [uncultured Clostridium sp.]|uniref:hypothetical protein n=1 Tax=uncultured Clostridium sp. TaxID=59620 RepID=UPI00321664FD
MAKSNEDIKMICSCCGKSKNKKDFYISKSFLHKGIERLPLCKECLGIVYDRYYKKYQDYKLSIYYMCRAVGICFNTSSYNAVIQEIENGNATLPWKIYMTKLNSIGGKNGAGEDFDSSDYIDVESEVQNINIERGLDEETLKKWGVGYSEEDYYWLESTYKEWIEKYKSDTLSEQKTFKLLTIKEFQIMKSIEEGKITDKLEDTYLKLMSAGNVTPRDANASMDDENTKGLGVWTRDIEKYRPAEYFKDKKMYRDFDGFIDYLNRFVFRPIKNFLMKTKEYDGEFSIEDDFKVGDD